MLKFLIKLWKTMCAVTDIDVLYFFQVVSQLFQQRIVRMGGPIEDEMANLCVAQLLYLDSVSPNQDVTLYINVSTTFLSL